METSLRYKGGVGGGSKSLRIHAKQNFPLLLSSSLTFLQVQGELDTKYGEPTFFTALLRHFLPHLSGSVGMGVEYTKSDKLGYTVRAKKSFPLSSDGILNFVIKARSNADKEFKEKLSVAAAAEFTLSLLNFQKDQDLRLKIGYHIFDQVPYMQIRENNWTVNADAKGRWNIRYDL